MNADTLKLRKLAEIVVRLMKKNGTKFAWNPAAAGLPDKLKNDPLDRLLQVGFSCPMSYPVSLMRDCRMIFSHS